MDVAASMWNWHVGAVFPDMDEALATFRTTGAGIVTPVARLDTMTFDPLHNRFVREVLDVSFLQLGTGVVELIVPVGGEDGSPQRRLLDQRRGPSHFAYWCNDVPGAATRLLDDEGAAIYLLVPGAETDTSVVPDDVRALVPDASAIYLQLRGGPIIELNPEPNQAFLTATWGAEIDDLLALVRPAGAAVPVP